MRPARTHIFLIVFWLLVTAIYMAAAIKQKQNLNLSATAGGQYPYLVYAKGMVEKGWLGHLGDRNRMPLYPALISLSHDPDWNKFVDRAPWVAIALSLLGVLIIGATAYYVLPIWSATAVTLAAAFGVYLPTTAFVQADGLFYALFFVSWLLLCDVLRRRSMISAAAAGMVSGLCFLTKASVTLMLVVFVTVGIVNGIIRWKTSRDKPGIHPRNELALDGILISIVLVIFLAVASPYLLTSKQRFGQFFYNVNTTFYIWCDSWSEAKAFGDRYMAEQQRPDAPAEVIPSASRYLRTHTFAQMARRLWAGCKSLAQLGSRSFNSLYLVVTIIVAIFLLFKRVATSRILRKERAPCWFTVVMLAGYALAYAWYAQIAYGERFILSLFLPAIAGLLWLIYRLDREASNREFPKAPTVGEAFAMFLFPVIFVEGAWSTKHKHHTPDQAFIQFYYNETKEREFIGDLDEARRGYSGVLALDPQFVPALHSLGMVALLQNRFEEAVTLLDRGVAVEPNSADLRNSLGSALVQAGRAPDALVQFRRAVELDPGVASAWLNLGGTLALLGESNEAMKALEKLRMLDKTLALRLQEIIQSITAQPP